ncbi:MAG: efflux RND transporter periplasmic adaptor subunit [Pseudodesulfovibrio sp.]|nr:efflux RND transporter periplasmic adaptor subunit [Pseudodesulfovibrio sp.]
MAHLRALTFLNKFFPCFHNPSFRIFFLIIAISCSLSACTESQKTDQGPPSVPVTTVKAETKDTPVSLKAVGNVKASNSVTVKSRVDGHILRIHFLDGDTLKAGQLLYTIDPETYIYTQKGAQANVAGDRASAELARKDYIRYKELFEKNVVSKDEYEQKLTAYETARKTMEADAAQEDIAKRNVHFTQITSPIDGIAGSTLLDEGNLVAADKDELVIIKTVTPADVQFSIPGHDLNLVRSHFVDDELPTFAKPASMEMEPVEGILTFVDNWVNPDTGMISLKARFANEEAKLWPGQFVTISLVLDTLKDAVQIPAQAVQRGPKGKYVYIVKDNKAIMNPVTIGMRINDKVVVNKGLAAGETVIIEGMLRLFPNAPVTISEEKGTDNSTEGGNS